MSDPAAVSNPTTPEPNEVLVKLKEIGVPDAVAQKIMTDFGPATVEDLSMLTADDFVACGLAKIPARRAVVTLAPKMAPAPEVHTAATAVGTMSFDDVLPAVPTDESWLTALRAGGVLKVEQSTVISSIRAALAHRAGLFGIPEKLVHLMELFADANEEQVSPEFFKLRRDMTRRNYADIFEAVPGLDGSYVTDARKKQLFARIDERLWPAIITFYDQLKSWQEAWLQGAANPAMMMNALFAATGGGVGMMPPGMMQPPDTGVLRDNADAVNDAINRVFAGTGVPIVAALAYEANRIKETLTNPALPALIGAANREQMLRQLGVAVSATYPRLEVNLTRFVLATLQSKDQPASAEELRYFGTLYMLGSQIPWADLATTSPRLTGIGGGRPSNNR